MPTDPDPSRPPRVEYLDSVRGLAATVVVVLHYMQWYGTPAVVSSLSRTPVSALWDGSAAVQLFFVLSGLVLSLRYFRHPSPGRADAPRIAGYVAARTCRIYLPYLAVLGLSLAVRHAVVRLPDGAPGHVRGPAFDAWATAPTVSAVLHQAVLFRPSNAGDPRYALVPQAWSLANEFILSCLVPAGVLVAGRGVVWLAVTTAVAVGPAGLHPAAVNFALGLLLARDGPALVGWLRPRPAARVALAGASVLAYTSNGLTTGHGCGPTPAGWLVAAGAAGLVLSVTASDAARRSLSVAPLRHLGRVSYSVYLLHVAVLMAATPVALWSCHGLRPPVAWGCGLVATVAVTVALAGPAYRWIEVPTIRLGRWAADAADRAFASSSSPPARGTNG